LRETVDDAKTKNNRAIIEAVAKNGRCNKKLVHRLVADNKTVLHLHNPVSKKPQDKIILKGKVQITKVQINKEM
jgi:hypothetical protein